MNNIRKDETYHPLELESQLQSSEIEELEARLEMVTSWCTSGCGTEKPA
jgi:hypothetical protein